MTDERKAILEFKNHHYIRSFQKRDDLYCPKCGKKELWMEKGPGDYYQGVDYFCLACGCMHNLDHSCRQVDGEAYKGILEQLRTNQCWEPKTPRGN